MVSSESRTEHRSWQRMHSGRRLNFLSPSPFDVEIEDIARGLARLARWNGQTSGNRIFSVAQHALLVVELLEGHDRAVRLAGLLHDGAEYVIGDIVSPLKAILGESYHATEDRVQRAIHMRFGLPAELPSGWRALIKRADRASAAGEAVALAGFSTEEARQYFGDEVGRSYDSALLEPLDVEEAEGRFLECFGVLSEEGVCGR